MQWAALARVFRAEREAVVLSRPRLCAFIKDNENLQARSTIRPSSAGFSRA